MKKKPFIVTYIDLEELRDTPFSLLVDQGTLSPIKITRLQRIRQFIKNLFPLPGKKVLAELVDIPVGQNISRIANLLEKSSGSSQRVANTAENIGNTVGQMKLEITGGIKDGVKEIVGGVKNGAGEVVDSIKDGIGEIKIVVAQGIGEGVQVTKTGLACTGRMTTSIIATLLGIRASFVMIKIMDPRVSEDSKYLYSFSIMFSVLACLNLFFTIPETLSISSFFSGLACIATEASNRCMDIALMTDPTVDPFMKKVIVDTNLKPGNLRGIPLEEFPNPAKGGLPVSVITRGIKIAFKAFKIDNLLKNE